MIRESQSLDGCPDCGCPDQLPWGECVACDWKHPGLTGNEFAMLRAHRRRRANTQDFRALLGLRTDVIGAPIFVVPGDALVDDDGVGAVGDDGVDDDG